MQALLSAKDSQAWLERCFSAPQHRRALALGGFGALLLCMAVPEGGVLHDALASLGFSLGLPARMGLSYALLYALWIALFWRALTNHGKRLLGVSVKNALIGAGVGLGFFAAVRLGIPLASELIPALAEELSGLFATFSHFEGVIGGLLVLAWIVPGEELIWRSGVLLPLVHRFGPMAGITAGSLLFAAAHIGFGSPLLLLAAFGAGALWGFLMWWRRSVVAALISHLIWDAMLLYAFPLPGMAG